MSSLIDNKYILPKPIHLLDFLTYTSQVRLSVILPSLSVSLISLSNGLTSSRLVQMMSSLPDTNSIHPTHIRLPSFLVYTSPVRWNVIPCVLSLSNAFTSSIHENLSYLSFLFLICLLPVLVYFSRVHWRVISSTYPGISAGLARQDNQSLIRHPLIH